MKKKLLYILIISILGIILLEAITRLFLFDDSRNPVVPAEIGQFNENLGWALKPLALETSTRTGYFVEYKINSKGLRDDETTYEKPDSVFRIVLLGDSRTFGFGIPMEKHFPYTLEGYFKNVEVINMGISGFGLDQMLLYLRSEGFKYNPDMVILYLAHYGDHRHLHTKRFGKEKPRFKLINGKLELTNWPIKQPEQSLLSKINRWILKYSLAYEIFYEAFKAITTGKGNQDPLKSLEEANAKNFADESFKKELYELGEGLTLQIAKDSKEFGAEFVLINQIEILHNACLQKNIFSLNVTKALTNSKYRLKDDLGHFNETGSGVLSWEITEFLLEKKLIPAEHILIPVEKY